MAKRNSSVTSEAGNPPAILWLGNSQLPAINRYKQGDATAATLLHDELSKRNAYLVSLAQPNANLAEHGLIFGAVAHRYKPRLLVLPVFLDDIREQGIRPLAASFIKDPIARAAVKNTPMWPHLSPMLEASSIDERPASGDHALQQRVESWINTKLADSWPLWRQRVHLRGLVALMIHSARNKLLGINSQSKRKVDLGVYTEKMRVLKAILEHAKNSEIRTLVYIPPYRQDIVGPYITADYSRLKKDLARLTQEYGAHFANLEHVVPGPEWGTVVDPLFGSKNHDFMHFTGYGHRRLAEALDAELRQIGF